MLVIFAKSILMVYLINLDIVRALREGQRETGALCGGHTLVDYRERYMQFRTTQAPRSPKSKGVCLHMKIMHTDGHANCLTLESQSWKGPYKD